MWLNLSEVDHLSQMLLNFSKTILQGVFNSMCCPNAASIFSLPLAHPNRNRRRTFKNQTSEPRSQSFPTTTCLLVSPEHTPLKYSLTITLFQPPSSKLISFPPSHTSWKRYAKSTYSPIMQDKPLFLHLYSIQLLSFSVLALYLLNTELYSLICFQHVRNAEFQCIAPSNSHIHYCLFHQIHSQSITRILASWISWLFHLRPLHRTLYSWNSISLFLLGLWNRPQS